MRILEACFSPSLGGLELYCLDIAGHLQRRGHEVTLWLTRGSKMASRHHEADLPVRLFRDPLRIDPAFVLKARRLIREGQFDVLHLHRSRDLGAFAWLKSPPRLLTLHMYSRLPKRDLYHQFIYHRLDRLLTISQMMQQTVLRTLPVKPEKVQTLYHGVDVEGLRSRAGNPLQTRQRLGIPPEVFLVGLVGRLEPMKGQEVLLKAIGHIYQRFPRLHAVLVGATDAAVPGYDQSLRDLARNLDISDRVHFAGFQVDTAPIFAALDLFVLASEQEAFGLVLLEAMAQEVAVIATNAGGVPEIVQDGINGRLTPYGDDLALAEALSSLMEEEAQRHRLARAGFHTVCEKFTLARHLEGLETHFADVIRA
jgi:glycosyltransferase involved in cell wall biosynthesis